MQDIILQIMKVFLPDVSYISSHHPALHFIFTECRLWNKYHIPFPYHAFCNKSYDLCGPIARDDVLRLCAKACEPCRRLPELQISVVWILFQFHEPFVKQVLKYKPCIRVLERSTIRVQISTGIKDITLWNCIFLGAFPYKSAVSTRLELQKILFYRERWCFFCHDDHKLCIIEPVLRASVWTFLLSLSLTLIQG